MLTTWGFFDSGENPSFLIAKNTPLRPTRKGRVFRLGSVKPFAHNDLLTFGIIFCA